jgi:2OG-Fe(II) oxygenase superfamily
MLLNSQHLGTGVVLFPKVIDVNQKLIIPYIASLKEKAIKEDYNIIYDENKNPIYAINRSGHRYTLEEIQTSSSHIMNFIYEKTDPEIVNFFEQCEKIFYQGVLNYTSHFPMLLTSLWWRTQGHILAYGPGSGMGLHSDNDVNYQPGFEPDLQVATRSVVGVIIYFNDSVHSLEEINQYEYLGGEIDFPYAKVTYKPKAGDMIMFPSNYLGAHNVNLCSNGSRYAYIGYFSQGSQHPERGINITQEEVPIGGQGQIWMPNIVTDYINFIKENYTDASKEKIDELLRATDRMYNSANTMKEISNDI